ncbi:MAG: hypothetical protein QXN89_03955 [Candidatus Woesearchaeota archaeon]
MGTDFRPSRLLCSDDEGQNVAEFSRGAKDEPSCNGSEVNPLMGKRCP